MFGLTGSSNFASLLQGALISVASGDDFRNDKGKHDTGWGAVWYSEVCQKYYRSRKPIFEDVSALDFFKEEEGKGSPLAGLSHARLAAPDEPRRSALDSHPFSSHIGDDLIYVTHNGWIDKTKLAEKAQVKDASTLNDTEVFTFLLEKMEGNSIKEKLEAAIEEVHTKSAMIGALNLIVLSITRDGGKKLYFHCDFPDKSKELYYTMYKIQDNQNSAVMSSTVAYKAGYVDETGEPKSNLISKCDIGKVLSLD